MNLRRIPTLAFFFCLWNLLAGSLMAASNTGFTDLGQGLSYRRVSRIPVDLPSTSETAPRCLILDLRGTASEPGAASALTAWLQFRSKPEYPTLVLVNDHTDRAVRRQLSLLSLPGVITLGPSSLSPAPDLPISVSSEKDAAACAALAAGTSVDKLIVSSVEKPRRDEAHLNRVYSTSQTGAKPADAPKETSTTNPKDQSEQTLDAVLARAIHVHRSLIALRRLPNSSG